MQTFPPSRYDNVQLFFEEDNLDGWWARNVGWPLWEVSYRVSPKT